jgi:hypothetical protein
MKPIIPVTMLSLILTYALPLRADVSANVNLPIQEIGTKGLLPLDSRGGFVTPAFKFFDRNTLVGLQTGAPTLDKSLEANIDAIPPGFANPPLKDELTAVNIIATSADKTVLIYTMNKAACPPCDRIVEKVKRQLSGLGWGNARILVVNIVWPPAK